MYTSYFANLKKIPAGLEPVAISIGIPRWYKGRRELLLAPTREMLAMPGADYDRNFVAKLRDVDPQAVYGALGENAVMLCWEKPWDRCHRRLVAEWFEQGLGVEITELGFDRSHVPAYFSMNRKRKA